MKSLEILSGNKLDINNNIKTDNYKNINDPVIEERCSVKLKFKYLKN